MNQKCQKIKQGLKRLRFKPSFHWKLEWNTSV